MQVDRSGGGNRLGGPSHSLTAESRKLPFNVGGRHIVNITTTGTPTPPTPRAGYVPHAPQLW